MKTSVHSNLDESLCWIELNRGLVLDGLDTISVSAIVLLSLPLFQEVIVYLRVLIVSSAFVSAGETQAIITVYEDPPSESEREIGHGLHGKKRKEG